jgi:hypothetical protein
MAELHSDQYADNDFELVIRVSKELEHVLRSNVLFLGRDEEQKEPRGLMDMIKQVEKQELSPPLQPTTCDQLQKVSCQTGFLRGLL